MHDPRIGRFFAIDPLTSQYPHNSPYAFSENCVISCRELEGLEMVFAASGFVGKMGTDRTIRIISEKDIAAASEYINWYNSQDPSDPKVMASRNVFLGTAKDFHSASSGAKAAVSALIYSIWINSPNNLAGMRVNNADDGTSASTTHGLVGDFTVYPNVTHNGEKLMDNFYNQLNVWVHEEQHSIDHSKGLDVNSFRHWDIERNAMSHWSFKFTTENFKDYTKHVLEGYLDGQFNALSNYLAGAKVSGQNVKEAYDSDRFQGNLKAYQDNVEWFNKTYGADLKTGGF